MLRRSVEREVLPYCRAHDVGFVPYYPLAGGFLTGKYEKGKPPPAGSRAEDSDYVRGQMTEGNFALSAKLRDWADGRGRSLSDLAQAWLLAQPQVCSVITGAKSVDQLLNNVKAADWALTESELREVEAILKPKADR
jgi:aryl-alcohol dehydrogenase-like predicted oxidoreductase